MHKQIISNDEAKINIVILKNDALDIVAKGISKCHADDEYDKELGISIANTRAWLKYYEQLRKYTSNSLEWEDKVLEYHTKKCEKLRSTKERAEQKIEEITAEYEKLVQGI